MKKAKFLLLAALWAAAPAPAEVLRLEDALRIAGDRSPTLAEAHHGLETSRHELEAQRAGLKSRLGLTVTPFEHSRDRTFNELVSGYNTQEQTHAGARFTIQQTIEPTRRHPQPGAGLRLARRLQLLRRGRLAALVQQRPVPALQPAAVHLQPDPPRAQAPGAGPGERPPRLRRPGAADREPGDAPVPGPLLPSAQPGHRRGGDAQRRGEPGDRRRQGGGRHHRPRGAAPGGP